MCTNDNLSDDYTSFKQTVDDQIGFLESPEQILSALTESKRDGTAIGINAPPIFNGVLVTGIDDIVLTDNSDPIIILKKYDSNGYFLRTNRIKLSEIKSVCPFTSSFENPFLKELGSVSRFYYRTP